MGQSNAAIRLVDSEFPGAFNDRVDSRPLPSHNAALYTSAFAAAMEAIPTAAFLLSPSGVVIQANAAGRSLLSQEAAVKGSAHADALKEAAHRSSPMFAVTKVPNPGFPDHQLAILRRAEADLRQRISAAAQRWRLTQRQSEVLALLARGFANKTIAAKLDRAEVTIELHVSAMLAKAQCQTRAQLLCALLVT